MDVSPVSVLWCSGFNDNALYFRQASAFSRALKVYPFVSVHWSFAWACTQNQIVQTHVETAACFKKPMPTPLLINNINWSLLVKFFIRKRRRQGWMVMSEDRPEVSSLLTFICTRNTAVFGESDLERNSDSVILRFFSMLRCYREVCTSVSLIQWLVLLTP